MNTHLGGNCLALLLGRSNLIGRLLTCFTMFSSLSVTTQAISRILSVSTSRPESKQTHTHTRQQPTFGNGHYLGP